MTTNQGFTSIKDASYQSCINSEKQSSVADYILQQCPTFVDDQPKEILAQLREGQMLRYSEITEPKYYHLVDGNLIPCDAKTKGARKVDVFYAMSYSPQQFGQIRNDDPNWHSIIKEVRNEFSKYVSNRNSDLLRSCRKLIDERNGVKRERGVTKSFNEFIKDMMDTAKARVKTAQSRGDESADAKKLGDAIKSFYKVWNA